MQGADVDIERVEGNETENSLFRIKSSKDGDVGPDSEQERLLLFIIVYVLLLLITVRAVPLWIVTNRVEYLAPRMLSDDVTDLSQQSEVDELLDQRRREFSCQREKSRA